jgi:DNA-binding NtrC family response regulator
MPELETGVMPVLESRGRVGLKQRGEYQLFHCLVVSADGERQEMLARGAAEAGWETTIVCDAEAALACQRRSFVQLAFIDLESDSSGRLHELLEHFAPMKDLLTIACGAEGDIEEEIWVRQVGVWLYLPGVGDETRLSLLCDEARRIVERLHVSASRASSHRENHREAR